MTWEHQCIARFEHRAWRTMFDLLAQKKMLSADDQHASIRDRSTPKREWFADAWAWMHEDATPLELEGRFALLFLDDDCIEAMLAWSSAAQELKPFCTVTS